MMKASQINIKKLIAPILAGVILTGCADGNIHQFLNSDFLNATAPGVSAAGKAFYQDRYSPLLPVKVPSSFGNTAPDRIGKWEFFGFTGDAKENRYDANYYDPVSVKVSGSKVFVETFTFYSKAHFTRSKKPFLSAVIDYKLDCDKNTFKIEHITAYSSNRIAGEPVSVNDVSNKTKPAFIPDDSIQKRLFEKVCN